MDLKPRFFIEHLSALRILLLRSLFFFFLAGVVVYYFSPRILHYLVQGNGPLVFTSPAAAFLAHMRITAWFSFIFTLPYLIYQIGIFLVPAFTGKEKQWVILSALLSILLFFSGACLGYFGVFPAAYRFCMNFSSGYLVPMVSVEAYWDFLFSIVVGFGIIFQLPLVMVFLAKSGIVDADILSRYWREAIVVIFIIAAILTPPDIVSQLLMALPLTLLYIISLVGIKFIKRS